MSNKKKKSEDIDIKTSTTNLLLNVVIFLLFGLILYVGYSLFLKLNSDEKPVPIQESKEVVSEIIQANVLNGCGIKGTADRFTEFLRHNGVDVVSTDNYKSFDIDRTLVIDRRGNMANAKKIAALLGVEKAYIIQQLNDDYFLDVSVIIGKDYFKLEPLK